MNSNHVTNFNNHRVIDETPDRERLMHATELKRGDHIIKKSGESHPTGIIVGDAVTKAGKIRYLVELDAIPGMLHVYSPENLEKIA